MNPRKSPPEARAQAASTASATSDDGRLCPKKITRFCVRSAFISTIIGCVSGPEVVRCGCVGLKGTGEVECGVEKVVISLIRLKSPTVSGESATGILTGTGMLA